MLIPINRPVSAALIIKRLSDSVRQGETANPFRKALSLEQSKIANPLAWQNAPTVRDE